MAKRISPRQGRTSRTHRFRFGCRRPMSGASGLRSVLHVPTSSTTRGTPPAAERRSPEATCPLRQSVSPSALHRGLPDDPEWPAARPDAAHRRPRPPAPDRPANSSPWPNKTARNGTATSSPKEPSCSRRSCPARHRRIPTPSRHRRHPRRSTTAEQTDWPQILALYTLLERMTGNPMVTSTGPSPWPWSTPRAGLAALDGLDTRWPDTTASTPPRHLLTCKATPTKRPPSTCAPPGAPPAWPNAPT